MGDQSTSVACRYCREPIHAEATKCPHCGEYQRQPSPAQRFARKLASAIGIFTALLSLFYALKEGYFYIEQRQQQREMFAAHMSAAEHFLNLDNLEYAESSLNQAIQINPNDRRLRLQHFFLRSRNLLREVDYYGSQLPDEQLAILPELVTSGFSLLENEFPDPDRARLLLSLARLLQYDRRWQSPTAINDLFAQARELAPKDTDVAYWFGEWLINQEIDQDKGLKLINEAVAAAPDNAFYLAGLAHQQLKREDFAAAFKSLRRAIELRPKQQELQRIRASNESKYVLRRALLSADRITDITADDFFGISLPQRLELVEFTLERAGSDRNFRRLAAKLFHHAGQDDKAEPIMRELLGEYDERSDLSMLELYASILKARNNHAEAQQVQSIIDAKLERETYEEILETSIDGGHRYKVGLRVAKQNDGDGIRVLKVHAGYPFAKAGVLPGDRLLEFAHRKVTSLRSIWVRINEFSPGTDVPLKLERDEKVMTVTIVVE